MKIIITGGAGFIGSNAAAYYVSKKADVVLFDNLSRQGTDRNLAWLKTLGGNLTFVRGDIAKITDVGKLTAFFGQADAVLHLAAQVAVTTSVADPRADFATNALGTLNILEAMRAANSRAKFIYSSTNKVYGEMASVKVVEKRNRYVYRDLPLGMSESQSLDCHSPYGCSKGSADQYVHDYARIYGLDTVVFRQSCIYGPHQFGIEDQGWVAWFVRAALSGQKIIIYGDGKQVRDLLYIDDLIDAYDLAIKAGEKTRGQIYNIGGGPENTLSVWSEFGTILGTLTGTPVPVTYKPWRPGDQKVFVTDVRKAARHFGWHPTTAVAAGIPLLYDWVRNNLNLSK